MENETIQTSSTPAAQPQNTEQAQLQRQMCACLLDSALNSAHLPAPVSERIRAQFAGKIFEPAGLTQAIDDARALVSELTGGRVAQGPARISAMFNSDDQVSAAVHDLLGAQRPEELKNARPARLTGIRELYTLMTGDREFSGGYHPEHVQLSTTVDLPNLLKNAMNKLVAQEWDALGSGGYRWWEKVAAVDHFNSLQSITGILVGEVSTLPSVAEGAAYTELSVTDSGEVGSWTKYGGYVGFTLEMFERDETHRLRLYPRKLAAAGLRRISALVGSVFTANGGVGPLMAVDARYLIVPRAQRLTGWQILYPSFAHEANIFSENLQKGEAGDVVTCPEMTDANDWAAAADRASLPLTNGRGTQSAGLLLYNHNDADANHDNYADLSGADVQGDLPAPPVIELWTHTSAAAPMSAFLGQSALVDRTGLDPNGAMFPLFCESEFCETFSGSGITYSTPADAACSGGYYARMSWSGTTAVRLLGYLAGVQESLWMGGRAFRPFLRLQSPLTSKLWATWEVSFYSTVGGVVDQVVYESPGAYLPQGTGFILGPALTLPPYPVDSRADSCPMTRVTLKVLPSTSGPHAVNVDYFGLLALDGWRRYSAWAKVNGVEVYDDLAAGLVRSPFRAAQTHLVEGPGFALIPGKNSRFYLYAWREDAGQAVPVNQDFMLRVSYRARKRVL